VLRFVFLPLFLLWGTAAPYTELLRRWSRDSPNSKAVADAVVHYSELRGLDPTVVLGVIWVENRELKVRAVGGGGSVGVMQVQRGWLRDRVLRRECGASLISIEGNVCYGTAILKEALRASHTLEGALLRYNGCTDGPCRRYPGYVKRAIKEARDVQEH
jgi:soluble lytic murein transglycosylase-like protein